MAESSGGIAISLASIYPDVAVTREPKPTCGTEPATSPAPLQLDTYMPEHEPQFTVEIRGAAAAPWLPPSKCYRRATNAADEPLPAVPVPLLPGDDDAPLELQRAFTTVYDTFGYGLAVDYTQPPEVPLSDAEAAWAAERIRRWAE